MLIDERGRVFGKVNLIDGFVMLCAALLIPIAFLAWRLFRQDPPTVETVTPAVVTTGATSRVTLKGAHFRELMSAKLGILPVRWRVEHPEVAEIELPADIPVGMYPLRIFDQANVVFLVPDAVRVDPPVIVTPRVASYRVRFLSPVPLTVQHDTDEGHAQILSCDVPQKIDGQISLGNMIIDQALQSVRCLVRVTGAALSAGAPFEFHGQQVTLSGWIESEEHAIH